MSAAKPFHIYRSSAGSGKTRTLAREYILLALRHPEYFKYTLAVSFANKSAQEMKDRIIRYLGEFAKGNTTDLGIEIQEALFINADELQQKSSEVLSKILHQYTQFSISTIDAFFQRVIRAFTRESGLLGNFRLEVENERVMDEVIAELIDELGDPAHEDLTRWVIQFSREKLTEGENWNIADALKSFSKELFKENYKAIADEIKAVQDRISTLEFLTTLKNVKRDFITALKSDAESAVEIMRSRGITPEYFAYGEDGTAWRFFQQYAHGQYMELKPRVRNSSESADVWGKKGPLKATITELAKAQLKPLLESMVRTYDEGIVAYTTADIIDENFYAYGLLKDITRKLNEYKTENNIMLLSDASHFLNGVINDSDTPFIYEKVGSFYRHYLIDEFQDTSGLQWNNFKPLFQESLDQNNKSLVVGDVKQSIYRWRGSDPGLLQEAVEQQIGGDRTTKTVLQENWRSAGNIVTFNNVLFAAASRITATTTSHPLPSEAFHDVEQSPVKFKELGYVNLQFLENWNSEEEGEGEDQALRMIPKWLEDLQARGIPAGDITILVRKNHEGQKIADFLMHYKNTPEAKPETLYEVVSNESLRLDAAASVLLLLSALRYLSNPDDRIARGELVYEAAERLGTCTPEENESHFAQAGRRGIGGLVPEEFIRNVAWLVKLSLFELTETLIRIFALGENQKELVYLQSFQDVVLEFGGKDKNDIASFLEWWDLIKDERSVQVAAQSDAVSIFTIHKAKGLQFRYVIIPFCSWKMNHEQQPLLWAKSSEKPFDQLGYTAVRFKSGLEKSFFAADYREEYTKAHIDNLNLLYVAFTRAEEGMIIMAPAPGKKTDGAKLQHVGHLLYTAIAESPLRHEFDAADRVLIRGEITSLAPRRNDGSYLPERLSHYPSLDWRRRLVIRREGREFFQNETSDVRRRVNYGILIHNALSRIHYKEDAEDVLNTLNFEGMIIEEERGPLQEKLKEMMIHPVVSTWFAREWRVRTETPVIIPGGKLARIDRVISKRTTVKGALVRKAIVVDYKTGARKSEDRRQVEEYAGILLSMGYSDVEGYLLYVDSMEVVTVTSRGNLTLF